MTSRRIAVALALAGTVLGAAGCGQQANEPRSEGQATEDQSTAMRRGTPPPATNPAPAQPGAGSGGSGG